jgi:hypothetical protein
MKHPKLPATDSIQDLAHFWDSHDLTAVETELEEVTEPVFERKPGTAVVLRLEPAEAHAVEEIARDRGLDRSELVRTWVREKLGSLRA